MAKTQAALLHLTLRDLIDRAAAQGDCATRESLAAKMGIATGSLYPWIMGKRLPSDELMLSLCNLAAIDAGEGLLYLNVWRSKGRARATYIKLLHRLHAPISSVLSADIVKRKSGATLSKSATVNT